MASLFSLAVEESHGKLYLCHCEGISSGHVLSAPSWALQYVQNNGGEALWKPRRGHWSCEIRVSNFPSGLDSSHLFFWSKITPVSPPPRSQFPGHLTVSSLALDTDFVSRSGLLTKNPYTPRTPWLKFLSGLAKKGKVLQVQLVIAIIFRKLKAFIWDSSRLEFEAARDCNLITAGDLFGRSGYGVGLQKGSPWSDKVTLAILDFHESEFRLWCTKTIMYCLVLCVC